MCPKAGGCLDGKQHLSIGELAGNKGMKTLAGAIGNGDGKKGKNNKKPKNNKTEANGKEGEEEKKASFQTCVVSFWLYTVPGCYLSGSCGFTPGEG